MKWPSYVRSETHTCSIRCDDAVHYDIVQERGSNATLEDIFDSVPEYMRVISAKRILEYSQSDDVVGAWGIYFVWVEESLA